MIEAGKRDGSVDGRAARRQRNIDSVLDVAVELFTEGELLPSIEAVAARSGVSVRSIYRYFADPAELSDAAIKRHRHLSEPLARLPDIGQGPLEQRISDFVAMRLRLYDGVEVAYRAAVHGASTSPRLRDALAQNRNDLRLQLERQFATEFATLRGTERDAVVAAADVVTQLDSIEFLRRHRHLSVAETLSALRVGLESILAPRG